MFSFRVCTLRKCGEQRGTVVFSKGTELLQSRMSVEVKLYHLCASQREMGEREETDAPAPQWASGKRQDAVQLF